LAGKEDKKLKTTVFQDETRIFNPPKDLVENSNVMQWMKKKGFKTESEMRAWCSSNEHYLEFWDEMAKAYVDWHKPYTKVMDDSEMPYFHWFTGGEINITYNAVDRHAKGAKKDKVAYIWIPEPTDQPVQKITYGDLYKEVNKFANGLKSLGLKKGDRVSIYMPMIPQLPIAMLACAKLGVIHSVVFSGFSSKGLMDRAADCGSRAIITVDGFYRRGKPVPLKPNADEAAGGAPSVEKIIVYKRAGVDVAMKEGRDVWWHDLVKGQSEECEPVWVDPEHRLYILYTSGTTGKPKGIEHATGGNAVGPAQTLHWVFDLKDDDVWWCTADIGWVTGHSYIVYAPLILGMTSLMYEGAADYPDFGRWWKNIQDHKVTVLYTAPTAVRMFMKQGAEWPAKYDLSSLRLLGSVGEPINPEAWMWYREHIGRGELQIMDTWWQTETGTFLNSPLPITPLKPGSCTFPLPGYDISILDEEGNEVPLGSGGNIVALKPYPSMLRAFWGDKERFMKEYWQFYWDVPGRRGVYLAGDKAQRDKDGYFFIQGRIDDVLSVAGHRIANAEVESALVAHPKIAEAAVVGKPDEVKGESIVAFVILRVGNEPSPELAKDAIAFVRKTLGPVAAPTEVHFVNDLPKTRSGKIMRRVVKARALGNPVGDISTLMNPEAVDGIPKIV
jgi:acetyl-CoA synthetase